MAFTDLSDDFSIGIVKDIPVGVPAPRFPDLSLGADYVAEGMMIIIVAFAQTVAMAKLMGLKHNYKVDPNQEMFACGVVSIICSIFSGYISVPFSNLVLDLSGASFIDLMGVSALEFLISKYQSVGISVYIANVHEKCLHTLEKSGFMKKHAGITCVRFGEGILVQDSAGGKTQVASLFAAGLVLLVIMVIGPYFYYLPKCVLAAIVIVNLRSVMLKFLTVPDLWRKSRTDTLIWIITCAATIILDADIGLLRKVQYLEI
nr:hypothetical protein BaRGS_013392 [Batillaria attramentaria]